MSSGSVLERKDVINHCDVRRGVYQQILMRKKKKVYLQKTTEILKQAWTRDNSRVTNKIITAKTKATNFTYRLLQQTNLVIRDTINTAFKILNMT